MKTKYEEIKAAYDTNVDMFRKIVAMKEVGEKEMEKIEQEITENEAKLDELSKAREALKKEMEELEML